MSELVLQRVLLDEVEPYPYRITIHTAKKIDSLIKIAKSRPQMLPPLEVAITKDGTRYLVKRHSVYEALKAAAKKEFAANIHHVDGLEDIAILHTRLSQSSPVNPFAFLKMRQALGIAPEKLIQQCCLDPGLASIVDAKLSADVINAVINFAEELATRLSRVEIPVYFVDFLSKQSEHDQVHIAQAVRESILNTAGGLDRLNDRNYVFPTLPQLRLFASSQKIESSTIFRQIDEGQPQKKSKKLVHLADSVCGTNPHLGIIKLGKKTYRINTKDRTFAEIKDGKYQVVETVGAINNVYYLPQEYVEFVGSEGEPFLTKISSARQLRKIAQKIKDGNFRAVLVTKSKI